MIRVLVVCMGNICRSPIAQGMLEQEIRAAGLAGSIEVDSAGTHAYHVGEPPDPRAREAAARRGVELGGQRARQVHEDDFSRFDHVLAMDRDNLRALAARCPPKLSGRLGLFLDHAPELSEREVPDPYYGGPDGFEKVLDMAELAAAGFVESLSDRDEPEHRA